VDESPVKMVFAGAVPEIPVNDLAAAAASSRDGEAGPRQ